MIVGIKLTRRIVVSHCSLFNKCWHFPCVVWIRACKIPVRCSGIVMMKLQYLRYEMISGRCCRYFFIAAIVAVVLCNFQHSVSNTTVLFTFLKPTSTGSLFPALCQRFSLPDHPFSIAICTYNIAAKPLRRDAVCVIHQQWWILWGLQFATVRMWGWSQTSQSFVDNDQVELSYIKNETHNVMYFIIKLVRKWCLTPLTFYRWNV